MKERQCYKLLTYCGTLTGYVREIAGEHPCGFRKNWPNYWPDILHSSDTGENIGVQQDSQTYKIRLSLPTPRSTCFDLGTRLRLVVNITLRPLCPRERSWVPI